ncbi:MAG: HAD family hydrolase [Treponemataceae bacterium]
MIKAIIFDYGNVISVPQTGSCYEIMQEKTGIPREVFSSSFFKFREAFDLGEINGEQLYSRILADQGFIKESQDKILCQDLANIDMDSWRDCNQNVVHWIKELKNKGFKLGILSNMPYEFLDQFEKEIIPFQIADCAVFSCRVKMIKPNPAIYHHVLQGLGVQASEAIFFDDLTSNIEAAEKIGLHSILWTNFKQAQQEAQRILGVA